MEKLQFKVRVETVGRSGSSWYNGDYMACLSLFRALVMFPSDCRQVEIVNDRGEVVGTNKWVSEEWKGE